jgi:hypothetical protein
MHLLLPSHCVSFCFRRPLLRDIGSVFLSCSIRRCAIYYYCRLCKYYSACKSIDVNCCYSFFPSWSSTVRLCWCYSPLCVNSGDSYSVFNSWLSVWRAFCSFYDDDCVRWIQIWHPAGILWASFRSKCPTKLSPWFFRFTFSTSSRAATFKIESSVAGYDFSFFWFSFDGTSLRSPLSLDCTVTGVFDYSALYFRFF